MTISNKFPLVSVIVVCYNHSKYVNECLNSIINQPYNNIELIILDDCSTDESIKVINNWIKKHDFTCKFIEHKENLGLCKTLNEAIALSTGLYIKPIASDDVLVENYLPTMVDVLNKSPIESLFAFCDMNLIDANSRIICKSFFKEILNIRTLDLTDPLNAFFKINYFTTPSCIYKRSFYQKIGPYDETLMFEDLDMWLKFFSLDKAKFEIVNYIGVSYRKISSSMSTNKTEKYVTSLLDIYFIHQKNGKLRKYCHEKFRVWTNRLIDYPFSIKNLKYYLFNLYFNKSFLDFKYLVVYLRHY